MKSSFEIKFGGKIDDKSIILIAMYEAAFFHRFYLITCELLIACVAIAHGRYK